MNHYEKLRQKVNEIIPQRVEKFKFMDEVETVPDQGEVSQIFTIMRIKDYRKGKIEVCGYDIDATYFNYDVRILKNLGKPITILEVMAAYRREDNGYLFSFDRDLRVDLTTVLDYDFDYLAPLSTQEGLCGELLTLFK